jgi:hypothetical protein
MDVPGIKILTGFLNLFLFVLPQVFQLHTVQYNQQPSCNDEKKIVRAMQSSSTVIFMLHNFNPSPNTLMHHVVREPCHTGYLNTVQHTDNPRFLSSPYHKHQYLEQIQLVHSLVKRHHEQLAQHQLRFVVVSNENPYDVRYLVPPSSSNARSGGNTRAVRGGGDNTDYMKQVAVLSSYDATGISLAYLGLGM